MARTDVISIEEVINELHCIFMDVDARRYGPGHDGTAEDLADDARFWLRIARDYVLPFPGKFSPEDLDKIASAIAVADEALRRLTAADDSPNAGA